MLIRPISVPFSVTFFSGFTRAKNISNQISQIRKAAKKIRKKSNFSFNPPLFFSAPLFLVYSIKVCDRIIDLSDYVRIDRIIRE